MLALTQKHRAVLHQLSAGPSLPVISWVAVQVAYHTLQWTMRYQTRKCLRHLTPAQLDDIGISAADAYHEARKPFWRS